MKTKLLFAFVGLALIATPAYSQEFVGTWTGETQGRGGTQEVTLTISSGDDGLMGTFVDGGGSTELADVTIDGETLSFSRELNFGGRGGFSLTYTGEIDDDGLTLTAMPPEGGFGGGRGGGGGGRGARGGGGGGGRGGGFLAPIVLTRE